MFRKSDWTDQKIEVVIANLLRAGVTLAAGVVLAGGVVFLVRHGFASTTIKRLQGNPLTSEWRYVRSALNLRGREPFSSILSHSNPVARGIFWRSLSPWSGIGSVGIVSAVYLMFSLLGAGRLQPAACCVPQLKTLVRYPAEAVVRSRMIGSLRGNRTRVS
jgi:hypothetical protein